MLQNAYFLVKIGADTAENERHFAEILPKLATTLPAPPGAAPRVCGLGGELVLPCDCAVPTDGLHRCELKSGLLGDHGSSEGLVNVHNCSEWRGMAAVITL